MVDKHAEREDLIRFLKEFKKEGNSICELPSTFLSNAKNYFTTEMDSLDSIEFFWDFTNLFREIITDDIIESLREEFVEMAEQNPSYFPVDPDICRDDAYKIENLAKRFKVDMTRRIEELENHAQALEEEQQRAFDDDYDSAGSWRSEECNDSDIDSLFSTLKK
ncbi:MAG: hypothetical protein HY753_06005 [Nitrospirae bacterium]|nr:hypothetical protein [Nitrospirota bacterium]